MRPDADPAPGPVPVLAGGAHGPRGVCREVGHWHRLDSPGQRVSGTRESQNQEAGGETDLRSALVEAGWRLAEDRVRLGDMGRGGTQEGGAGATLYLEWES